MGRAFGAPITVSLATVAVWAAAVVFVWEVVGRPAGQEPWIWAAAIVSGVAVSVLLHELAHAWIGHTLGARVHQISLTAWGGVTHFSNAPLPPLRLAWVSLAGPAANLILAGTLWFAARAIDTGAASAVVGFVASANLALAIFNALPGAPLDGGNVLSAVVWHATGSRHRGLWVAAWSGRVLVICLVIVLVALPYVTGRGGAILNIVLAYLVGTFMWRATTAHLQVAQLLAYVEGIAPEDLVRSVPVVSMQTSAEDAERAATQGRADHVLVVDDQGTPVGVAHRPVLEMVPELARTQTAVAAVMVRLDDADIWPEWNTRDPQPGAWARLLMSPHDVAVRDGQGSWALVSAAQVRQYVERRPLDWRA